MSNHHKLIQINPFYLCDCGNHFENMSEYVDHLTERMSDWIGDYDK